MRCSHIRRAKHSPFKIVPELGQLPENDPEGSTDGPFDVFPNHEPGADLSNDANEVEEKAGTRPLDDAAAFACDREVLAGRPPADDVDIRRAVELLEVRIDIRLRPMTPEDSLAVRITLALPDRFAAKHQLQAELQAADAGAYGSES
jgi:hypothetical protein